MAMIKRWISLLLVVSVIITFTACVSAFAAEDEPTVIKIEAENFQTGDDIFSRNNVAAASDGVYISSWHKPTGKENLVYTYTFNAPTKGNYKLDGIFNELGQSFTTDITIYVNTPDNTVNSWSKGDRIESYYFYKMSGGTVKLNKGKNTLYMVINGTDLNSDGAIAVYLDCFTLTKGAASDFKLESVKLDNSAGMYEENKNVKVEFEYSASTPEIQRYNLEITDFWNREVQKSVVTVNKGVDTYELSLGSFPIGWYRLRISDEKTNMEVNEYMAFSVVVSYSKRGNISDSTIAADCAMAQDYRIEKLDNWEENFHDLAKLSGIKWLRTRTEGKRSNAMMKRFGYMMKDRGLNQLALTAPRVLKDLTMTGDLFDIGYNDWKITAEWYEDTLGTLEVINEADLGNAGNKGGSERYAAFYKAAAIGIADSKNRPYQTMTALAGQSGTWVDLVLANDILKYTDVVNYHAHDNPALRTQNMKKRAVAYTDEALPLWLTEAGYSQAAAEGNTLSINQMKDASEQLVKRAMQSLSNGNNKHFWFLLTPYIENGGNFSSQHVSGMPYPMYSVLSNLSYQLGYGYFAGIGNVPEGFSGYMFDDGLGNDVMVVFADNEGYVSVKADKVRYSDIVGTEEVKYADENGEIKVFVGTDPIYIKFFGRSALDNYYPQTFDSALNKREFTPSDRIVIQQLWSNEITPPEAVHSNGYQLDAGKEYEIPVKIYNFNDKKMSGSVNVCADSQIILSEDSMRFETEPWTAAEHTFKFKVSDNAEGGTDGYIRFYGQTDEGGEISSSVAYFKITSQDRIIAADKRVNFENSTAQSRWDLANIAENAKVVMTEDEEDGGAAVFNITFPGNTWFFPHFHITDEERETLKSAQGFIFDGKTAGHDGDPALMMFVYMKDGREFYCPSVKVPFEKMENGYINCIFPYTQFTLWSSPLGAVEIRPFDVESISHISIGLSGANTIVPEYRFKNFGYFYSDLPSEQLTAAEDVEIGGIESGKVYKKGELTKVSAAFNVPDNLVSYKVQLNNDILSNVSVDGKNLSIDLGNLERGNYTLYVTAKNKQNKFFCGIKTFKVE